MRNWGRGRFVMSRRRTARGMKFRSTIRTPARRSVRFECRAMDRSSRSSTSPAHPTTTSGTTYAQARTTERSTERATSTSSRADGPNIGGGGGVSFSQNKAPHRYRQSATLGHCVPSINSKVWTCPGFVEGLGLGIRVSCLTTFCPPVWWHSFVRPPAEPFFHPGPHENAAVARSGGQGRPHFGAARRACPCMRLSKSSAYLTHSPLPSFQFLCSTWNPVSSPRPARDGGRRAQGRSRSAVALPWPHARWFPGRTLIAPSTAARWLWSG